MEGIQSEKLKAKSQKYRTQMTRMTRIKATAENREQITENRAQRTEKAINKAMYNI